MGIFKKKSPDVLVVGAGPVGLSAALTLARRGVKVEIVDSEWRSAANSYALALHPASLELLDRYGLVPQVLERAYRVNTVGLWDERTRRAALRLTELPRELAFVAVLRQDVLESVLEGALEEAGVRVQWNHRVSRIEPTQDGVGLTIDKLDKQTGGYAVSHVEKVVSKSRDLTVPYVIAADGHRSFVRRALEIEFEELAPPRQFAVFEFETGADLDHELRLVFSGKTINACWPLPGGVCRWSFELAGDPQKFDGRKKGRHSMEVGGAHYPLLQESALAEFLSSRAPWFDARIGPIHWRMSVRFERRLAQTFGRGRVWLAGDAGHLALPVGVQSMNVGLRESVELADAIAEVLAGDPTGERLSAYDEGRQREWRGLLDGSQRLAAPEGTDPWLAERAGDLPENLPVSREDLGRLVGQLGLRAE